MRALRDLRLVVLATALLSGCPGNGGGGDGGTPMGSDGGPVTFASVYQILSTRCAGCHTGAGMSGMLAMGATPESTYAAIVGPDRSTAGPCGGPTELVTPGDPAQSFLYLKATAMHATGCGAAMPFGTASGLMPAEQEILRIWIADGATGP